MSSVAFPGSILRGAQRGIGRSGKILSKSREKLVDCNRQKRGLPFLMLLLRNRTLTLASIDDVASRAESHSW
jgi:hypothetical protein